MAKTGKGEMEERIDKIESLMSRHGLSSEKARALSVEWGVGVRTVQYTYSSYVRKRWRDEWGVADGDMDAERISKRDLARASILQSVADAKMEGDHKNVFSGLKLWIDLDGLKTAPQPYEAPIDSDEDLDSTGMSAMSAEDLVDFVTTAAVVRH